MNSDFKRAVIEPSHRERVIEIFRIFRINGGGTDTSEVFSAALWFITAFGTLECICFIKHFIREINLKIFLVDNRRHLNVVNSGFPNDAQYFSHGVAERVVPFKYSSKNFLSALGAVPEFFGNQ